MEQTRQPRRLAPIRKQKPPSAIAASDNVIAANSATTPMIPVDLSLDAVSEADIDEAPLVTGAVADWTLQTKWQHKYDNDGDDASSHSEEQLYQDTIGSSSHRPSSDASVPRRRETMVPDGYRPISLEELSTTTHNTSSSPLVLVHLEKLCGYTPDEDERRVIVSQLTSSLYHEDSADDNDHDNLNTLNEDGDGLEFDARVVELFESGAASHVDSHCEIVNQIKVLEEQGAGAGAGNKEVNVNTPKEKDVRSLAIIPYPEFLRDRTSSTSVLKSTRRLWKLLHAPHPLSVVRRLFLHLRNTSRSLLWKAEMHNQIRLLVIEERHAAGLRREREEYREWKAVRRERLEKLYEVRETFLLRVDVARDRYETLVQEREERVNIEMTRRRGKVWTEGKEKESRARPETLDEKNDLFDVDHTCDDDGWDGVLIPEEDIIGDADENKLFPINAMAQCHDDDSDSEPNEEWSPVGMSVVVGDENEESKEDAIVGTKQLRTRETIDKLEPITADDNMQRKSKRLEKAVSQTVDSGRAMREEETMVREKLKTTDELMAEAMLLNLQKRLDEVDTLLETIQEEEWAEEDEEVEEQPHDLNDAEEATNDWQEMTLLDQILAMILGALPMIYSNAKTKEDHYLFIKEEHQSILDEWKETFGKLPRADEAVSDTKQLSVEELRAMGNDCKEWDEEVDW